MRRLLFWLVGLFLFLALVWSGLWYAGSLAAGWAVDEIEARSASEGDRLSCQNHAVSGYPLQFKMTCRRLQLGLANTGIQAVVSGVQGTALLYRPGYVRAEADGPVFLDFSLSGLARQTATAHWQRAQAEVSAGLSGFSRASFKGENIELGAETGQNRFLIEEIRLGEAVLDIQPSPKSPQHFDIAFQAGPLAVKRAGRNLAPVNIAVRAQAQDVGESIDFDPESALQKWLDRGGRLTISTAAFEARGFKASLSGGLSLSKAGLFSGELALELQGIEELPKLALESAPGFYNQVEQWSRVLKGFAQNTEEGDRIVIPFIIRDNVIRAGLLPVGRLPALFEPRRL